MVGNPRAVHCMPFFSEGTKHSSFYNLAIMSTGTFFRSNSSQTSPLPGPPRVHSDGLCQVHAFTRCVIFAGMQHLPAIRHKASAFISPLDARASYVHTGMSSG